MIGRFYSDYHEARDAAEQLANKLGMNLRLRNVREYGRKGYVINLIPSLNKCFGRDLEGELVEPASYIQGTAVRGSTTNHRKTELHRVPRGAKAG